MSNRFEQNPYNEIVDLETFNIWLKDYKGYLLADPTVKREYSTAPDDRDMPSEDRIVGHQSLSFDRIPWVKIPTSIQEIISMQYESAKDPRIDKQVTIEFEPDKLVLNLISPLVKKDGLYRSLDLVGETYSLSGVELVYDNSEISTASKGVWWIDRSLPSAKQIGEDLYKNWSAKGGRLSDHGLDRFLASLRPESIPVSLNQLHDVAGLLINEKSRAVVNKLIPEVPRNN